MTSSLGNKSSLASGVEKRSWLHQCRILHGSKDLAFNRMEPNFWATPGQRTTTWLGTLPRSRCHSRLGDAQSKASAK